MMFFFTCFKFSGPEDNVAEYYQHDVEMLEGFTEMILFHAVSEIQKMEIR